MRDTHDRANGLDAVTWTRYSISVWSDIHFTDEEQQLAYPGLFPVALARRLLDCFAHPSDQLILDPFCGAGSTLLAARASGKDAVGVELMPALVEIAEKRLAALTAPESRAVIRQDNAANLLAYVSPETVDLCLTAPPYWGNLNKHARATPGHLARFDEYPAFLDALAAIMAQVHRALRPKAYCCLVVQDRRVDQRVYLVHANLISRMLEVGFDFADLLIWDRRADQQNLRPQGYPYQFRVNMVHEYILVFQKQDNLI